MPRGKMFGRSNIATALVVGAIAAIFSQAGVEKSEFHIMEEALTERPPVPASLFAFNIVNLEHGAIWPTVPFSGWRNFNSAWLRVEPQRGKWAFSQLDADVALAERRRVEPLLQLAYPPAWAAANPNEGFASEPRNLEDWQTYVRTIAVRYKGRVRQYELWNEPNVKHSYRGSPERLVELSRAAYDTLKAVDPEIRVVSPALSTCCKSIAWMERFLAAGGGAYADVIGFHFYVAPRPPEALVAWDVDVRRLLARYGVAKKPIWNTEMGWRFKNRGFNPPGEEWAGAPLEDDLAAAYIARSFILSWALGIERVYWYAWGHNSMGLTEFGGQQPKVAATAYAVIHDWLVGAKMRESRVDRLGVWRCELVRKDGTKAWIVWQAGTASEFRLPTAWNVRHVVALNGQVRPIPAPSTRAGTANSLVIRIGPAPILLEP